MESKYYTPSIEEFHYGFEFESNAHIAPFETKWFKQIFDERHDTLLKYHNEVPEFQRVKYLDKEDIESLGWHFSGKSIDIWFERHGSFSFGTLNSDAIKMHYGLHDNRLYIETYDGGDKYPLFEGTIKNKSELKKLMEQLGIV